MNNIYLKLSQNTNFDNTVEIEQYMEACYSIYNSENIGNIILIMSTMQDWDYRMDMIYTISDIIINFGKKDKKNFINVFLQNIEKMYPHAYEGLRYIFTHILVMEIFKPHVYSTYITLNVEQKQIFKEIYEKLVEEDREYFAIPEIDEAIKSIV